MKRTTKLLAVALIPATAFVIFALMVLGNTGLIGPTGDLLAYVFELATKTLYAIAIGGSTTLSMRWAGLYLTCEERRKFADAGDIQPLALETLQWFGWAALWAIVYLR